MSHLQVKVDGGSTGQFGGFERTFFGVLNVTLSYVKIEAYRSYQLANFLLGKNFDY